MTVPTVDDAPLLLRVARRWNVLFDRAYKKEIDPELVDAVLQTLLQGERKFPPIEVCYGAEYKIGDSFDPKKDLKTLIQECHFETMDVEVSEEVLGMTFGRGVEETPFPLAKKLSRRNMVGGSNKLRLAQIPFPMSGRLIQDILSLVDFGTYPANAEEFLTFLLKYRDLTRKEENIVCLGTVFQPEKESRYMPVILGSYSALTNEGEIDRYLQAIPFSYSFDNYKSVKYLVWSKV